MQDMGFGVPFIYQPKKYDWALHPLISYHAKTIDASHAQLSPLAGFTKGHYLGTDHLGRDVLAGIIRGCYNSLRIGILAVLLSMLVGTAIGAAMAYYKNDRIKLNIFQLILTLLTVVMGSFYFLYLPNLSGKIASIIIVLILCFAIHKLPFQSKNIPLPVESFFQYIITLRKSIPTLILILAFIPLFRKPSSNNIILLLTVIGWINIARHTRAESLSIMNEEFVISAQLMGAGFWHILYHHIWPLIKPTIVFIASIAFGSYLIIEASLSFLGIGLEADEVSWGSMIGIVRNDMQLWWLVLFPGCALFIIIYVFSNLFAKPSLQEIQSLN
jgi:peptide/nickel transport system permease protein